MFRQVGESADQERTGHFSWAESRCGPREKRGLNAVPAHFPVVLHVQILETGSNALRDAQNYQYTPRDGLPFRPSLSLARLGET